MSKLHILVLATGPQDKLVQSIEDAGHTCDVHNPDDLYLFVSESEKGYDCLFNGGIELVKPERLPAKTFDAVIPRIGENLSNGAAILRHVNENLGIYSTQDADGLQTASDKLKTTQKLSFKGLRVPKTIYAHNPIHTEFLLEKVDGLPAVAKLLHGSQGVGVNILETPRATNTMLQSFAKSKLALKIQKFVDADSKDIRAIVIGDTVSIAMERTAPKGDFRANISLNGSGREITLSDEDTEVCVKAAKAIGLEFAGVDIMKGKDGKTYVIEVNGNPGSKIIDLTGHNYFDDLIKHVEKKVKKRETKGGTTEMPDAVATQPGLIGTIKATLFGSKTDPYAKLSPSEIAAIEKRKELKARYPSLMKGIDV